MTSLAEPSLTDVEMVVAEVWSSFLGDADPLLMGPPTDFGVGWSSAVSVSGEWQGSISVELTTEAAEEITRRMLMVDATPDADVADAVGELVNMIGGGVKSLMPGPSALSLPVVAAGRVARPSDALEICRFDGTWAGTPLVVSVHIQSSKH